MQIPEQLRYTKEHEWVRVDGADGVIGITDFAQEALGDVVFVELPAIGTSVTAGQQFGVVESNKSVSELYAPVGGRVVAVNEALRDRPELVNTDPYGDGWMIRIAVERASDVDGLLDAEAYQTHVAHEDGR